MLHAITAKSEALALVDSREKCLILVDLEVFEALVVTVELLH